MVVMLQGAEAKTERQALAGVWAYPVSEVYDSRGKALFSRLA